MFPCSGQCSNGCNSLPFRNSLKVIDNSYQSLSIEEQERIHRDLYGIQEPIKETPEFVNSKLEELTMELDFLNEASKRAYVIAKSTEQKNGETEYISSRKFRLMFLRAERFDAHRAASRLARYLQEKLDLFGYDVLSRKILFDDLSEQDKEVLSSGFFCVTNETDTAGRLVLFFRRCLLFGQDVNSMLRAVFYLLQIAVEDNEEAQTKGLVLVNFNYGTQHAQWASQFRKYIPIFRHAAHAFPIRIAALHVFYNDAKEKFLLNLVVVVFPHHLRSRFHCHYVQTFEECLLFLMSLGINPSALPYTEEGYFRSESLCNYLAEHSHSSK